MLTPDGRTDGRTDEQTNERKDENYIPLDILRMPGYKKTKAIYPSTYFVCRGYKNVRNFCTAKVSYNFSTKIIAAVNCVSTVRLYKSLTNNFVKLTML